MAAETGGKGKLSAPDATRSVEPRVSTSAGLGCATEAASAGQDPVPSLADVCAPKPPPPPKPPRRLKLDTTHLSRSMPAEEAVNIIDAQLPPAATLAPKGAAHVNALALAAAQRQLMCQ